MPRQQERRQNPRKRIEQLTYIQLPSSNGGIVIDISEGGLRFCAVAPLEENTSVEFLFSGVSKRMAAAGEVIWADEDRKTGGLRFTSLPDETRDLIRAWQSGIAPSLRPEERPALPLPRDPIPAASPAPKTILPAPAELLTNSGPLRPLRPLRPLPTRFQGARPGKRAPSRLLMMGVASLAGVIGFTSNTLYHEVRGFFPSQKREVPSRQKQSSDEFSHLTQGARVALVSAQKDSEPEKAGTRDIAGLLDDDSSDDTVDGTRDPEHDFIFVQVATFADQSEATQLLATLRQQQLVAFTSPGDDGFYRVQLGPYITAEAADAAEKQLVTAGFHPSMWHEHH